MGLGGGVSVGNGFRLDGTECRIGGGRVRDLGDVAGGKRG